MTRTLLTVLGLLTPAHPAPSPPIWYDFGHRVVARIAEARLTPAVRAAVRHLLGGQDLASAASWADQIRASRNETAELHFVNIPLDATRYDPARHCPGGRCLIAAIERDRQLLADPGSAPSERTEALRFLVHWLADLHQPLHVSDNGDRGGNDVELRFLGRIRNLHQVWDGEIIEAVQWDEAAYLDHLARGMKRMNLRALERGTVVDWAMEGHRVAVRHAYRLPPSGKVDSGYVKANLPRVDRALIAAGVRLAWVLNTALRDYRPVASPEPTPPGSISDREAAAHAGELATVVGTVVSVRSSRGGNHYLNFGADYPHQTFSGVVLQPEGDWTARLDSLTGRRVAITGRIELYRGQPQIRIERADQIAPVP